MAGMNLVKCVTPVEFKDGLQVLMLDAVDLGDRYRLVFRWADALSAPDQGPVPGLYIDQAKHCFQKGPIQDGAPTVVLNQPVELDMTFAEMSA